MTHFTGICTFPHGGFISAGLLLASCAALVATTYAVASCRIVVLTFVTDSGDFEQSFSRFDAIQTETPLTYKVALGLFQWLRSPSVEEWDQGTCAGYQETMMDDFQETYFELARGAGSVAVLLSILVVLWSMVNSCIAWNMWQIIILSLLLLGGTVATCLCFMIFKSDLCNNVFESSSCSIDEGGLVLVAGVILWVAAFLITAIFMRDLDRRMNDNGLSEIERARVREMAYIQEKRAREKERKQRQLEADHQRQLAAVTAISYEEDAEEAVVTPTTIQSAHSYEEEDDEAVQTTVEGGAGQDQDEYEVYINNRMQRIDEILQDIQDSEDRYEENHDHRGVPVDRPDDQPHYRSAAGGHGEPQQPYYRHQPQQQVHQESYQHEQEYEYEYHDDDRHDARQDEPTEI